MSSTRAVSKKPSRSSTADRAGRIAKKLAASYADAECALVHSSALELLVATILSAQCTDVRVNLVTKELFKRYKSAKEFADSDPKELEAAKKHGKIVELNAYPNRLDLDWIHCRRAKEMGVMLSINPDAHSTSDLENIEYGVATARRAWLEEKDVLNTRGVEEALAILNG